MKKNKKLILGVGIISLVLIITSIFLKETVKENKYYSTQKASEEEINDDTSELEKEIIEPNEVEKEDNIEVNSVEYVNLAPEDVKIPILMYHSICADDPDNGLLVAPEMFNEQMQWLNDNGFTTMSLDEVCEAFNTGEVPEKPVAITFDDGYADNYLAAYPILKEYNMKATFFIITNNTDKDGYYMTSDMLKEMKEQGMSIENHTAYHFELAGATLENQQQTIEDGQAYLKEIIGVEGSFLCYPAGKYDETTISLDSQLGVKAAVTTEGGFATINDGIYTLKRVRIAPMNLESFTSIFSPFTE